MAIAVRALTRLSELIGATKLVVDPSGAGDYTTLSAALAAITDNAAAKQYTILVTGAVAETDTVTAKSYVHVQGVPGASVTVTKTTAGNGFVFSNLVFTTWRGLKLVRAGACGSTASIYGVQIIGTCDNTVVFENCHIENSITGTGTDAYGVSIGSGVSTTAPILRDCYIKGGDNGLRGYGLQLGAKADPQGYNLRVKGGSGAATGTSNCMGITSIEYARGYFKSCRFEAGDGGNAAYGGYNTHVSCTRYEDCDFIGGNGAANSLCMGFLAGDASSPQVDGGTAVGGSGTAGGARSIYLRQGTAAKIKGIRTRLWIESYAKTGVTATTTLIAHVTKPIRYLSIDVFVVSGTGAGSGGTVSIGTTLAGTDIVNAQDIQTVPAGGWCKVTPGAGIITVLAANAPLYITVDNGTGSNPSLYVYYTYCIANANSQAVYVGEGGNGAWELVGCQLESNPASDAIYVEDGAVTANTGKIVGCNVRVLPRDTAAMKAINAEAAWNPAPVYNCVLEGGTTNITAAPGTANGTNTEV